MKYLTVEAPFHMRRDAHGLPPVSVDRLLISSGIAAAKILLSVHFTAGKNYGINRERSNHLR
jgi:hypothetical protein